MAAWTNLELMRARALSAWVSHRSVRTSISLLSCNHSSRLGLPSKPNPSERDTSLMVSLCNKTGRTWTSVELLNSCCILWDIARPYFDSRTVCSLWVDDSLRALSSQNLSHMVSSRVKADSCNQQCLCSATAQKGNIEQQLLQQTSPFASAFLTILKIHFSWGGLLYNLTPAKPQLNKYG